MRKSIDWKSAYAYAIFPKGLRTEPIEMPKMRVFSDLDNSITTGHDSVDSLEEAYPTKFKPFDIIDNRFIACRFPFTKKEMDAMENYLTKKGLIDITKDGTIYGVSVEDIDYTNIPDNAFMIIMVYEVEKVKKANEIL